MTKEDRVLLAQWEQIATNFLRDKHSAPSELESSYFALRKDNPTLADKCKAEADKRKPKWKNKLKQTPTDSTAFTEKTRATKTKP